MRTVVLLASAWLAGTAFAGANGRIVDPSGAPIAGAYVCEITLEGEKNCVATDAAGMYRLDNATHPNLLVRAKGFVATTIDAAPLTEPVKLRIAGRLFVTVVDAGTGKPLHEGKVMVDAPSGKRIGDFVPFNQSGVKISTLEPGNVLVRATATGYEPSGPVPVVLVGGEETNVSVRMSKSKDKAR
jgi:hypothetical protein